jgi:hypothetical protein
VGTESTIRRVSRSIHQPACHFKNTIMCLISSSDSSTSSDHWCAWVQALHHSKRTPIQTYNEIRVSPTKIHSQSCTCSFSVQLLSVCKSNQIQDIVPQAILSKLCITMSG